MQAWNVFIGYFQTDNLLISNIRFLYSCILTGLVDGMHGSRMTHGEVDYSAGAVCDFLMMMRPVNL